MNPDLPEYYHGQPNPECSLGLLLLSNSFPGTALCNLSERLEVVVPSRSTKGETLTLRRCLKPTAVTFCRSSARKTLVLKREASALGSIYWGSGPQHRISDIICQDELLCESSQPSGERGPRKLPGKQSNLSADGCQIECLGCRHCKEG